MTAARVGHALVLAAGRATRLQPLSAVRAKAAMPVAGEPIIRRLLAWLARQGVRDIVVNLHHLPQTITGAVGDGSDLGVRVRYSWESQLLGTAGGIRHALPLLAARRFFVLNADTLCAVALDAVADAHQRTGALVTLALVPSPDPARYGGVELDEGWVARFLPPGAAPAAYHFVGVQLVEADVFEPLPDGVPAESIAGVYQALVAGGARAVAGFVSHARFYDIGTPADYHATSAAVAREEGRPPHPVTGEIPPGARCRFAPSARLRGTIVWDDVTVEADAELTECIVADGVRVPAGSRWHRQVIVPADAAVACPDAEQVGDLFVVPLR